MIDLTPLDVRKKKGDFKKRVRGYDPQLVDDFLDLVAERLEELVKQQVELSERSRQLQDQVASFRERERALNEALVAAQELREQARAQAQRESELVRREAEAAADRILDEGQRALRDVKRQFEALESRKASFMRAFRSLLERYLAEVDVADTPVPQAPEDEVDTERPSASSARSEPAPKPVPARGSVDPTVRAPRREGRSAAPPPPAPESSAEKPATAGSESWLSSIFPEAEAGGEDRG